MRSIWSFLTHLKSRYIQIVSICLADSLSTPSPQVWRDDGGLGGVICLKIESAFMKSDS